MSQPRLAGTVPSPEQARANLAAARKKVNAARSDVDLFRLAVKDCRAEIAALEEKREAAESDLCELGEKEGPAKGAEMRKHHRAAVAELRKAGARLVGLQKSAAAARAALKLAVAERTRVEDDLEAIDLGRRPG